jgi:hypothetical protein
MQYGAASCQLDDPVSSHVAPESASEIEHSDGKKPRRKPWAPDPAETIAHTTSRRSGPRAWLRDLLCAAERGLVPGFNDTTRAIAEDLCRRMDYGTGHVRYCLEELMARTGLSRSAVTDHVKRLRRAGWLAWAEHGSLRNALRKLGVPGYARTATVYAATIPPAYDEARGNVLEGTGYGARVVGVTEAGRAARTPSLRVVKEDGHVQVGGGLLPTARARHGGPGRARRTILGAKVTRCMADAAERVARQVRPLVNWCQGATLRQLSWVLLDVVARGWDEQRITGWLAEIGTRATRDGLWWRPARPHRWIAAQLLAERADEQAAAQRAALEARRADPAGNAGWGQAVAANQAAVMGLAGNAVAYDGAPDAWELEDLRVEVSSAVLWGRDPELIAGYLRNAGPEAARDLYGDTLVAAALRLMATT